MNQCKECRYWKAESEDKFGFCHEPSNSAEVGYPWCPDNAQCTLFEPMAKREIVHLQRIDMLLIAGCGIKLGGDCCGSWTTEKDKVTCKNCLEAIATGKFDSMFSAITERKEYFANAEPSCIYASNLTPMLMSNVIPMSVEKTHSCVDVLSSCITELPEYPGEKTKWQRSKTLLRICLYYIKRMLLITRLFYDNSQKNSE